MPTEKRERSALLKHAGLCRKIAREVEHARASERLIKMAHEYEARAARFNEKEWLQKGIDKDALLIS
jgi:hypothetical protein